MYVNFCCQLAGEENRLLMMSATQSRASGVRGVKFSTCCSHREEDDKNANCCFTFKAHFRDKCAERSIPPKFSTLLQPLMYSRKSRLLPYLLFSSAICWRIYTVQRYSDLKMCFTPLKTDWSPLVLCWPAAEVFLSGLNWITGVMQLTGSQSGSTCYSKQITLNSTM